MKYLRKLIGIQKKQIEAIESSIMFRNNLLRKLEIDHSEILSEISYLSLDQIALISKYRNSKLTLDILGKSKSDSFQENIEIFSFIGPFFYLNNEKYHFKKVDLAREKALENIHEIKEFMKIEPEYLFESICAFNTIISASYFIEGIDLEIAELEVRLQNCLKNLNSYDKWIVEDSLLTFLSKNWIYLNLKDRDGNLINYKHLPMINLTESLQEKNMFNMSADESLRNVLDRLDLKDDVKQSLKSALKKIEELVWQDGVSVFDIFSEKSTVLNLSDSNIMVLPGEDEISCRDVLIGISSSKGKRDSSPKEVMSLIRETMVHCSQIKVCVFISDVKGMGSVLEDNLRLFNAYTKSGNLIAFLPIIVVGRKITLINWR